MKIACFFYGGPFVGGPKLGGAERRIGRIFDELALIGEDTELIIKVTGDKELVKAEFESVLTHHKVKILCFVKYSDIFLYVINKKFDWICYTDSYRAMLPFLFGGIFARSKRLMLNVTTTASILKFDKLYSKALFFLVTRLSNQIDCLYPCGIDILTKTFHQKKVTLTPCPFTNLDLFKPKSKKKEIVFLASLNKYKNPEIFVKAISKIQNQLRDNEYKVFICGNGTLEMDVKQQIINENCEDIIKMTGHVCAEVYLPQAELFLSLQVVNNYPSQSLLEAIACGCYIIASDEGDTNLLVKSEFGSVCNLNSDEIAKNILSYILKTKEEKEQITYLARKFAIETFVINNSVKHYNNLFYKWGD